MAKFQPRWTPEQRDAVVAACLRYGMSTKQVARAAAEGTLPGPGARLEPFPIAWTTVRTYRTRAARAALALEEASSDPATVLHDQATALAVQYRKLVNDRIRAKSKMTAGEITELAKAGREVQALLKALDIAPAKNGREKPVETPSDGPVETPAHDPPDFIDALAQNGRK